jgi:hypothetical protein
MNVSKKFQVEVVPLMQTLNLSTLNLKHYLFPLFGRGGHPFLLDQKGRKNQGKTKSSARFPKPRARHQSK